MGMFDTVIFNAKFLLVPEKLRTIHLQTKSLTDKDGDFYHVLADGTVARADADGGFSWNPALNGWVDVTSLGLRKDLLIRINNGRVVSVEPWSGGTIDDFSDKRGAYWSPDTWKPYHPNQSD